MCFRQGGSCTSLLSLGGIVDLTHYSPMNAFFFLARNDTVPAWKFGFGR
jgi:hypothetical protein